MQLSLIPVQITSAQITPTDSASATDTTVFSSDTGIPVDNQLTYGILDETPNNATLSNSSSIIQSAVLPPQHPVTPVTPVSSIDDDDDNDDGNDADNDDDRSRPSSDNGNGNDDSNMQSISIQRSEGGVSVSVG